jgi:hypothetical protein
MIIAPLGAVSSRISIVGRTAVGYFSGQGNMSPLAFNTPWKEDRVDTNGKSTSGYVGDVLQRIVRLAAQAK